MRLSEPCSLFRTIEPAVPATSSVGLQIMHGLTSILLYAAEADE
jgi:hypothetical protein